MCLIRYGRATSTLHAISGNYFFPVISQSSWTCFTFLFRIIIFCLFFFCVDNFYIQEIYLVPPTFRVVLKLDSILSHFLIQIYLSFQSSSFCSTLTCELPCLTTSEIKAGHCISCCCPMCLTSHNSCFSSTI